MLGSIPVVLEEDEDDENIPAEYIQNKTAVELLEFCIKKKLAVGKSFVCKLLLEAHGSNDGIIPLGIVKDTGEDLFVSSLHRATNISLHENAVAECLENCVNKLLEAV